MTTRTVYRFGMGVTDGRAELRELLGGKGANLAEMANAGLPVPPGFTIATTMCEHALAHGGEPTPELRADVRSGAAISMPGMMDTILNLGMNDEVAEALGRRTKNARFAWDCYRRFIEMFASVAMGASRDAFEEALDAAKKAHGKRDDRELDAAELRDLANRYKAIYRQQTGHMFPTDPREQLHRAPSTAVFRASTASAPSTTARCTTSPTTAAPPSTCRRWSSATWASSSGTGVCFTRNPKTGEPAALRRVAANAQGEDVVAGIRTPTRSTPARPRRPDAGCPTAYAELVAISARLERHFRDMQDIEFTVEEGKLYMLQTRTANAPRGGGAHRGRPRREGVITADEACRVEPQARLELRAAPGARPQRQTQGDRQGPPASPAPPAGRSCSTPTRPRASPARRAGRPRAHRDQPRRHPGHDVAQGILTRAAADQPRGGRRARHGQALRRGLHRHRRRLRARELFYAGDEVVSRRATWITIDGGTGE
jgi:pyruvate,orthophosphate dikinase